VGEQSVCAPVAVIAVGNPSRGDDALGPALLARFADWLATEGRSDDFELIEDFQLQIEHAVDLRGRALVLFIDAMMPCGEAFRFAPVQPLAGLTHTSHALSPEAVLMVYGKTYGEAPPPAFVLGIGGEAFELGEPISPAAAAHLEAAFGKLCHLAREARPEAWAGQVEFS